MYTPPIILDSELVISTCDFLMAESHSRHIHKSDAEEMALVGEYLEKLGILHQDKFLNQYSTTIGKSIYTWFEIGGMPPAAPSLEAQIDIFAHEVEHSFQLDVDGINFVWRYLTNPDYRAAKEANALITSMEVWFYLSGGELRKPAELVDHLTDYNLQDQHIAVAKRTLELASGIVSQGGIITRSGNLTINHLRSYEGKTR